MYILKFVIKSRLFDSLQVVQNYDAVSPLDQWMTTILLTIKKNIKQEDELM